VKTIDQLVRQFANSIPSDIPRPEAKIIDQLAAIYWKYPGASIFTTIHDNGDILFSQWDASGVPIRIGSAEASDTFPPELESMIRDAMRENSAQ